MERVRTTKMRSTSVVSGCLALTDLLSLVMTMEERALSLSPIELNMTRPRGIPMVAYAIVNNLPQYVFGVEWP